MSGREPGRGRIAETRPKALRPPFLAKPARQDALRATQTLRSISNPHPFSPVQARDPIAPVFFAGYAPKYKPWLKPLHRRVVLATRNRVFLQGGWLLL